MQDKYHLIGINGIGMSALAHLLCEQKKSVSGSDLSEISEALKKKGVTFFSGHKKEQIEKGATVVYSSAISKDNPELLEAQKLGCTILHRSDLLMQMMHNQKSIAVAGTHGKTTTTALLFSVLSRVKKTNLAMGGEIIGLNQSGLFQEGEIFVFEADESDKTFLKYSPDASIITNVEKEHMENYHTEEELHRCFTQYCKDIDPNFLVLCGDDPFLKTLKGIHYGFSSGVAAKIENFHQEGFFLYFDLLYKNKRYEKIGVKAIGRHNAKNAAAVLTLCLQLGISEDAIREGLQTFEGVKRRAQITYDHEVLLIDDYAHHPTEVVETLKALRNAVGARNLNVIFQPHRFTRLKEHFDDFAKSFWPASCVYLTKVYAASEKEDLSIDLELLRKKIQNESKVVCHYCPENLIEKIENEMRVHDVFVTMGAGSVTKSNGVIKEIAQKGVKKSKVALVYGGPSYEHEISCKSFGYVKSNLPTRFFDLDEFFIDKEGKWFRGEEKNLCVDLFKELASIDLFFPVMHGGIGEDGKLQAFFEVLQKSYAGPDSRSAMIAMDKVLTKQLLELFSLPTPKYVHFSQSKWRTDKSILKEIQKELEFPLYVKPVHLGSSIGVTKVGSEKELECAIDAAFIFDDEVLVEQGLVNCRELEFAVLGDQNFCFVTAPGEKLAHGEFVDYKRKYLEPVATKVIAEIDKNLCEKGKLLAEKVFRALKGHGIMRVDFLLDATGNYYCFEVNAIPGLTVNSLYPKMMQAAGMGAEKLLELCVLMGFERYRKRSISLA